MMYEKEKMNKFRIRCVPGTSVEHQSHHPQLVKEPLIYVNKK